MRYLGIVLLLVIEGLSAAQSYRLRWPANLTFGAYMHEHNLSELYRAVSAEDMQYVSEIRSGEIYYELREGKRLLQALIPIGEEMQIHLMRDPSGKYRFDIVPIVYRVVNDAVSFAVGSGVPAEIKRRTGHRQLSALLGRLYRGALPFTKLQPKDRVAFIYTQKERLGLPYGTARIRAALVETGGRRYFAYADPEGHIYHGTAKTVTYTTTEKRPYTYTTTRTVKAVSFRMPLDRIRITSRFSLRRWHPILKKYRPHYGVDFGAKRGTPLRAVHDGKVIFAGWMRGYGKVVKIDHGNGFVSLYAHQSAIKVKRGQRVKRGQIIGRVGSTGRSTGPHLHFGLYRYGKPVDPLRYLRRRGPRPTRTVVEKHTVIKEQRVRKQRRIEIREARRLKRRLEAILPTDTPHPHRWSYDEAVLIRVGDLDKQSHQGEHHG
jgi:murein DD-endopeptidase MepM/ murein hydrolase activator NlpD